MSCINVISLVHVNLSGSLCTYLITTGSISNSKTKAPVLKSPISSFFFNILHSSGAINRFFLFLVILSLIFITVLFFFLTIIEFDNLVNILIGNILFILSKIKYLGN